MFVGGGRGERQGFLTKLDGSGEDLKYAILQGLYVVDKSEHRVELLSTYVLLDRDIHELSMMLVKVDNEGEGIGQILQREGETAMAVSDLGLGGPLKDDNIVQNPKKMPSVHLHVGGSTCIEGKGVHWQK